MNNTLVAVNFNNQTLTATLIDSVPHVALKPICENLGLDWASQFSRIKRHPILSKGVVMITTPSNGGLQEMMMLPLKMLNGWLFGIDSSRVKAEIKDAVIKYQEECFDVLANHFMPKPNALRDLPPKTITPAMQRQVQKAIANLVRLQVGTTYSGLYGQIKDKFEVGSYKDVSFKRYGELCEFLNIEPIEGELLEPVKLEYQPPKGMVLIAESELEVLRKVPAPIVQKVEPIPTNSVVIPRSEYDAFKKLDDIVSGIRFSLKY